jgi:hypothetical protein
MLHVVAKECGDGHEDIRVRAKVKSLNDLTPAQAGVLIDDYLRESGQAPLPAPQPVVRPCVLRLPPFVARPATVPVPVVEVVAPAPATGLAALRRPVAIQPAAPEPPAYDGPRPAKQNPYDPSDRWWDDSEVSATPRAGYLKRAGSKARWQQIDEIPF